MSVQRPASRDRLDPDAGRHHRDLCHRDYFGRGVAGKLQQNNSIFKQVLDELKTAETGSVAILVSEILDLVSPKYFGMT